LLPSVHGRTVAALREVFIGGVALCVPPMLLLFCFKESDALGASADALGDHRCPQQPGVRHGSSGGGGGGGRRGLRCPRDDTAPHDVTAAASPVEGSSPLLSPGSNATDSEAASEDYAHRNHHDHHQQQGNHDREAPSLGAGSLGDGPDGGQPALGLVPAPDAFPPRPGIYGDDLDSGLGGGDHGDRLGKGSLHVGEAEAETAARNRRFVMWVVVANDLVSGVGSGMSVKFFPLYFKSRGLSPAAVNFVMIGAPLVMALGAKAATHIAEARGRPRVTMLFGEEWPRLLQ